MWHALFRGFVRRRRGTVAAMVTSSALAALFLTLLCTLFYNMLAYDAEHGNVTAGPEAASGLLILFVAVLLLAGLSLMLIVRGAFRFAYDEQIREVGVLTSVGATPAQVNAHLMREAALLCLPAILVGCVLGTAGAAMGIRSVNAVAAEITNRAAASFHTHPLVIAVSLGSSAITVLLSAWLPAHRMARLSPLEAIREPEGSRVRRRQGRPLLRNAFGIEGRLAAGALHEQRKALRTTSVSFALAFLSLSLVLSFLAVSQASVDRTYFARYLDTWDVMLEVPDTTVEKVTGVDELRTLDSVTDVTAYQVGETSALLSERDLSAEVQALGGLSSLDEGAAREGDTWRAAATVVVLDDVSFDAYRESVGAPTSCRAVILNRIWDSASSDFRSRSYLPYLNQAVSSVELTGSTGTILLDGCELADEAPALREEYEDYSLVLFIPAAGAHALEGVVTMPDKDVSIRLLAGDDSTLEELDGIQSRAERTLVAANPSAGTITSENRLHAERDNNLVYQGYSLMMGGLCAILAAIGIANVATTALGFLSRRRREFARYRSIGMTNEQLGRMLALEAASIVGRPLAMSVAAGGIACALMLSAGGVSFGEFLVRIPAAEMAVFALLVIGSVGILYFVGGRRLLSDDLSCALRDEYER